MEGNLLAIIQGLPDQQFSIVLTGADNAGGKDSTIIIKGIPRSSFAQTPAQVNSTASQFQHRRHTSTIPPSPPAYSSLFPSYSGQFRRSSSFRPDSCDTASFIRSLRDYSHSSSTSRTPSAEVLTGVQSREYKRRRVYHNHRAVNTLHIGTYSMSSRARSFQDGSNDKRRRRHRHQNIPITQVLPQQDTVRKSSPLTRHGRETGLLMKRICGDPITGKFGNIKEELKTWFTRQSNDDVRSTPKLPQTRHRMIIPGSSRLPTTPHNSKAAKTSMANLVNTRLRVGGKRIRYCPKSGNSSSRCRDQPAWSQLSRSPDVCYLHEITRCIRDTLRSVCNNSGCPSLQQRYREHALVCPEDAGPREEMPPTRQLQDITTIDPAAPQLRPEDVECTSEGIVIDQKIVCPPCQLKPCGCRKTVTCKKMDQDVIINDKALLTAIQKLDLLELKERLCDWLNETLIFDEYTFSSKSDKQEKASELADILTNITGEEKNFKAKAYEEIKEFVNKLPTKYPGSIGDLEKCKHEAIKSLFKELVSSHTLTRLKKVIDDWLIELPIINIKDDDFRRRLVNDIAAKVKPVIMNQPESRDEYTNALFNEIGDILLSLPLQVKGNVTKVLGHYNEELLSKLFLMTPEEAIKKCRVTTFGKQEEEAVLKWLQSLPVFSANTPTAICKNKTAVADLINILNTLQLKEKHNFRKTLTHHLRFWLRHFAIKQNHFIEANATERYVKELVELFRLPDEEPIPSGLWLDTENIGEHISDWIPEIPEFALSGIDEKKRTKVIKEFQDILNTIENDENYLDNVKAAVDNWLDKEDIQIAGNLKERNRRKSEIVQSFLDQITDASGMTGLEYEIYEWTKSLPIKRHLGFDSEYFVKEAANRLKPIIVSHPEDKEEYYTLLEDEIDEIIEDVPLKIEGNRTTLIKKVKTELLDRLKRLPSDEAVLKVKAETFGLKEQKQIFSWLTKIPGFNHLDPQSIKESKKLASELAKVLNPMKAKDPDNFEENLREHLKYWLSHNLLKNNTNLDKKIIESYVEQLVTTLTSEPTQPKKHIREQLQNEVKEILAQSRIRVSHQEELETNLIEHLMNFVGHKESETVTKDFIQQVFRRANVPPSDAEDLGEELMIYTKSIMRSMPTKRKLKKNLKRPVFNLLEQENIQVENKEELQNNLIDLLADYKTRKTDDVTAENKLYERLLKENISASKCRDLASELMKQAREVPQHLPPKREIKDTLRIPVNEIIENAGILLQNPDQFKAKLIDLLADHMLGTKSDEEVRTKLLEDLRMANVNEEDAEKLTNLLMKHTTKAPIISIPRRQVKQILKNPVTELLDHLQLKISNRENFDNSIIDTLASFKLGKNDERATKQTLFDMLRQVNVPDNRAQDVVNEMMENVRQIPTSTPPRTRIIQNLNNPINEVLREISSLNDRKDIKKDIINILADYKLGKADAKLTRDNLQTVLVRANVPKNNIKSLISDLIDNCREIAYILPPKKEIKHFFREHVENVLDISGVPVNKDLNKKVSEVLSEYIQGTVDDQTAKDKLFSIFREVDLPNSTTRDIIDEVMDQSKHFVRKAQPKKNVTKQILITPVQHILQHKDIPIEKQKVIEEKILELLVEFKHDNTDIEAAKAKIIHHLKSENINDITASELADELTQECYKPTIAAPTKTQIKQYLRNPIASIYKSSGVSMDQQKLILNDTIETLTEYKRGTIDQEVTVKTLIDTLAAAKIPKEEYENLIPDLMGKTDALPLPLPQKRLIKKNLKTLVGQILQKTEISENDHDEVKDAITESLAVYTQGKFDDILAKSKIIDAMKYQNIENNDAIKYADEFITNARNKTHKMMSMKQFARKWKNHVAQELKNFGKHDDKLESQITFTLANHSLGRIDDKITKNKLLQCLRSHGVPDDVANSLIENLMSQANETYIEAIKAERSQVHDTLQTAVKEVVADLSMVPAKKKKLVNSVTETLEDFVMRQIDESTTEKNIFDSFRDASIAEPDALNYTQKCMNLTFTMSMMEELNESQADEDKQKPDDNINETKTDANLIDEMTKDENNIDETKIDESKIDETKINNNKFAIIIAKSGVEYSDKKIQERIFRTLTENVMKMGKTEETKLQLINQLQEANVPEENIDAVVDQLMGCIKEPEPLATSSPRGSDATGIEKYTKSEDEEQIKKEKNYAAQVKRKTVKWLNTAVKNAAPEEVDELAESITKDIIERQAYFRLNPDMKVDEQDDLLHYQQKAGLWKNKLAKFNIDKTEAGNVITQVGGLLKSINELTSPQIKDISHPKPSEHESQLVKSLEDTTIRNAEDVFKKDFQQLTKELSFAYSKDKDKENEIKKEIYEKVTSMVQELNRNPEIFNDPSKYKRELNKVVDSVISKLPPNNELDRKITQLKSQLFGKVDYMRQTITDEREGQDYKKQISRKISAAFPPETKKDRDAFEAFKENLTDNFINANFAADDEQYRKSISKVIYSFCDSYEKKFPDSPNLPKEQLDQYLFDVLKQVPIPKSAVLEREVAEIKGKKLIYEWMKTLPLTKQLEGTEKMEAHRNSAVLAKQLENLTKQKEKGELTEEDYNTKIEEEIEKFAKTLPIKSGEKIDTKDVTVLLSTRLEDSDLTRCEKVDTSQQNIEVSNVIPQEAPFEGGLEDLGSSQYEKEDKTQHNIEVSNVIPQEAPFIGGLEYTGSTQYEKLDITQHNKEVSKVIPQKSPIKGGLEDSASTQYQKVDTTQHSLEVSEVTPHEAPSKGGLEDSGPTQYEKLDTSHYNIEVSEVKPKEAPKKPKDILAKQEVCCYDPYKKQASPGNVCSNPRCKKRNVSTSALPSTTETQTDTIKLSLCGKPQIPCPRHTVPPVIVKENQKAQQKKSDRGISAMPSSCGSQTCNIPAFADTHTGYPRPYYCQIPSVPCRSYCGTYQKPYFENTSRPNSSYYTPAPCWSMPYQRPRCNNNAQCDLNCQADMDMQEHEISHSAVGTDPEVTAASKITEEQQTEMQTEDDIEQTEVTKTQPTSTSKPKTTQKLKQQDSPCKCLIKLSRNICRPPIMSRYEPRSSRHLPCPLTSRQYQNNIMDGTHLNTEDMREHEISHSAVETDPELTASPKITEKQHTEVQTEDDIEQTEVTKTEPPNTSKPKSTQKLKQQDRPCKCLGHLSRNICRPPNMFKYEPCSTRNLPCPLISRQYQNKIIDDTYLHTTQENIPLQGQEQIQDNQYEPCENTRQPCTYTPRPNVNRNENSNPIDSVPKAPIHNGPCEYARFPCSYRKQMPSEEENTEPIEPTSFQNENNYISDYAPCPCPYIDTHNEGHRQPPCYLSRSRYTVRNKRNEPTRPVLNNNFEPDYQFEHTVPECPIRRRFERGFCENMQPCSSRRAWSPCGPSSGCRNRSPCRHGHHSRHTCQSWGYGCVKPCQFNRSRCNSPGHCMR